MERYDICTSKHLLLVLPGVALIELCNDICPIGITQGAGAILILDDRLGPPQIVDRMYHRPVHSSSRGSSRPASAGAFGDDAAIDLAVRLRRRCRAAGLSDQRALPCAGGRVFGVEIIQIRRGLRENGHRDKERKAEEGVFQYPGGSCSWRGGGKSGEIELGDAARAVLAPGLDDHIESNWRYRRTYCHRSAAGWI